MLDSTTDPVRLNLTRAEATEVFHHWWAAPGDYPLENLAKDLGFTFASSSGAGKQARTIAALQNALATAVDQRDRALSKLDEWIERADARRERIVRLLDDVLRSSEEAK